ncbi:MAG: PLP-dependent aminotransferase family protein [Candidatus Heimdallarchaeota archaeon]|nr:MAG: PLP-dependent aminotransferase family protein [Candidatus Heimdallarchaeota archaeon]
MTLKYANRMDQVKGLETREIIKFIGKSDIISFAGGLPAPELFPLEELKEISAKVLEECGSDALQYVPTDGYLPLREMIAERMQKTGVKTSAENILIINGSQQGIDFSGKLFLNPGDVVISEKPCYLGAIGAFRSYQAKFVDIPIDNDGIKVGELEKTLSQTPKAKLIYVTPDFQNPTGISWSVTRRKEFIEVVNKFHLPVIEDNPYGEIRFEGKNIPPIKAFDTEGNVVFLGTFSKILCPGFRIGWICASRELVKKYTMLKEVADLQCNTMAQREVALYLSEYDITININKIRQVYKRRRDLMIQIIKEEFPPEAKYSVPEGGLFLWIEFPKHINGRELLEKTLQEKVAFVPGGCFYPNGGHENSIRLNFSNMPEEKIVVGMKRLAKIIHKEL